MSAIASAIEVPRTRRLEGLRVALFCDFKFEDMEVLYPKMRLEEEGATVHVCGVHPAGMKYTGKFGYPVKSDVCVTADFDPDQYQGLVLPGGFAPDYMRRSQAMLAVVARFVKQGKPVCAICHGPWMLCSARDAAGTPVVSGKRATCFVAIKDDLINAGAVYVDNPCVIHGSLISAQTPNDLPAMCCAMIHLMELGEAASSKAD